MSWETVTSFVLVTGGAGLIGVGLARLALGTVRPRGLASDLLIGAGAVLAGFGPGAFPGARGSALMASLALLTSGTFLHLRERGRHNRELGRNVAPRELP